jgi:hypothetical protein
MVLLELHLANEAGIVDEKNETKRLKRLRKTIENTRQRGLKPNPLVANLSRSTQRSLQLIRWLRCHIFGQTPYANAVEILRPLHEGLYYMKLPHRSPRIRARAGESCRFCIPARPTLPSWR